MSSSSSGGGDSRPSLSALAMPDSPVRLSRTMSAAQRKVDSENIPVVAYMFSEPLVHLKPDGNIKPLPPYRVAASQHHQHLTQSKSPFLLA